MLQPQNVSGGGSAGDWRPETITSAEPQGRWGGLDVFRESGVVTFLPGNTCDGTPENDNDEDTQQSLSLQHRKPASLAQRADQRPNAALVLAVLSGLAAVSMASPSNRDNDPWIPVADAETLGKIGQDPDYPLNGNYRQTVAHIDGGQLRQSIGNDTHPFTGILRGEKGTIGNLTNCLVKTLAGEGRVDNLRFTDANIRSKGPTAVVACKISDQATVSNICVDNARVVAFGKDAHAGIVGGDVRGGTVANTTAVNCTVEASNSRSSSTFDNIAKAGIGAGRLLGGKVANTTAVNCAVAASTSKLGDVGAGIGAGYLGDNDYFGDNNIVANTTAVNCTVTASGRGDAVAGIGAGYLLNKGIVANTTAVNCKVVTPYGGSAAIGVGRIRGGTLANTTAVDCKVSTSIGGAGIGAGWLEYYTSRVTNTTAVNCQVENAGASESEFVGSGSAGIGAGHARNFGTVADTTAVDCQVVTSGMNGGAGIGVGRASFGGTVVNTSAMNCTVKASGKRGMAGIGAGMVNDLAPTVANTTAVNCNVLSSGHGGSAGIGAGMIRRSTVSETIADTSALNCTVLTLGDKSTAGIGAGDIDSFGAIVSTKALNCKVDNLGKASKAAVRGGRNPDICNVGINGHWLNNTDHRCGLDNLCAGIDHRLVTRDCQPGDDDFMELIRNNTRQFELCPVTPTILPPTSIKSGPTMTMLGLSNASIVSVPTTPGKSGTAASGLDNIAIAGIALGGVLFLLIGVGVCIYRYCCHRARAAGSHYEPLLSRGRAHSLSDDIQQPLFNSVESDNERIPLLPRT